MRRTAVEYQQPSRASRMLVSGLAIAVALLASWILVSNFFLSLAGTRTIAVQDEEPTRPTRTTGSQPAAATLQLATGPLPQAIVISPNPVSPLPQPALGSLPVSSVSPLAPAPVSPFTHETLVVEPEPAASLPEPIVIASTQGLPTRASSLPSVPPPLPAQPPRSAEQGSAFLNTFFANLNIERSDNTDRVDTIDHADPVPLPPRRPKLVLNATDVPIPRARPVLEDATERPVESFLSDAEIARMAPK